MWNGPLLNFFKHTPVSPLQKALARVNVRMLIHEFYMSGFAMCVFAASAAISFVRRL